MTDADWDEYYSRDTWVEVRSGGELETLRDGQETVVGSYGVFVDRAFRFGMPGEDASVAVFALDDRVRRAAVECAPLLSPNPQLEMTRWDGTKLRSPPPATPSPMAPDPD
jgi:hypothetical protein